MAYPDNPEVASSYSFQIYEFHILTAWPSIDKGRNDLQYNIIKLNWCYIDLLHLRLGYCKLFS
jgi:hypothetical protein